MRRIIKLAFATALVLSVAALGGAEEKADLVTSKVIWDQPPRESGTDLARFQDQWFVTYVDSAEQNSTNGAVRVITSEDGVEWTSVALLTSPTPKRGLYRPGLSGSPDGQLMVTALGVVPNPNAAVPVPKYGGTINTMAWLSGNGREWSNTERIGVNDYPFGRVARNNEVAFSYGNGCICGSAQTIRVFSSTNGRQFQSRYEETFSGFFPGEGALFFADDLGYCLMSRNNGSLGDAGLQKGFVGKSKPPYTDWKWQEIDARINHPNPLRLDDGRIVVAAGIVDKKTRTSLCEFDPATGNLTELLEFPTSGRLTRVGLALHKGEVWASYHAAHNGRLSVHLAQVKLK
jgi:hypothetical protein